MIVKIIKNPDVRDLNFSQRSSWEFGSSATLCDVVWRGFLTFRRRVLPVRSMAKQSKERHVTERPESSNYWCECRYVFMYV